MVNLFDGTAIKIPPDSYIAGFKAVASAYTHKACAVLRTKLPKKTTVCTLHSFLVKRPTINDKATTVAKLEGNQQTGAPEVIDILFVDEFSMVGEKDFVLINDLLSDEEGNALMKIVYIGDPNQLPPVKDAKAITPKGKYWFKLTEVFRQANTNPLIDTLLSLNDYINGEEPQPLLEHDTFTRGVDIASLYPVCITSKVLLAYTNARVEELNAEIEGRAEPIVGDNLYSPTTRKNYILTAIANTAEHIQSSFGDMLSIGSKYKTLETLHKIPQLKFYYLLDEEGQETVHAAVFGHSSFLKAQQNLANSAVVINKQILAITNEDPKEWARANWGHSLSRERAKSWSQYLAFKDFAIFFDFVMTSS